MLRKKDSKCPECGRPVECWIIHYTDGQEWACGCHPKYKGERFMPSCEFTDGHGQCYGAVRRGYGPTQEAAEAEWAKNFEEYRAERRRMGWKE